ncbi:MAG: hypothetical protein GX025_10600 [Clostridiales bacterium]|nr:hypothetical protein [Clostridiales bacterium]
MSLIITKIRENTLYSRDEEPKHLIEIEAESDYCHFTFFPDYRYPPLEDLIGAEVTALSRKTNPYETDPILAMSSADTYSDYYYIKAVKSQYLTFSTLTFESESFLSLFGVNLTLNYDQSAILKLTLDNSKTGEPLRLCSQGESQAALIKIIEQAPLGTKVFYSEEAQLLLIGGILLGVEPY